MESIMNQEYLKLLFNYDLISGNFINLKSRKFVGHVGKKYKFISIKGKGYPAHRLAWIYVTGKQPMNEIDHIDQNKLNNSFVNLREATASQNRCNVGIRSNNTSGFKGVSWDARNKKWRAHICINRNIKYLGLYKTAEEASEVYKAESILLHKEFRNF